MTMRRRHLLQAGTAAALSPWAQLQALAQTTGGAGYRALVCLFMFGGNDGNNMVIPTDTARFGQYQNARGRLALARGALLPIARVGEYALHPAMAGMQRLVNEGHAAVIANVGPLAVPTTKAQYRSRSVPLPGNLFSHSDQQGTWQTNLVDSPGRSGWGGRLLERALAEGTTNRGYSAISVAGANLWEAGDRGLTPYRVSASGEFGFDFYDPRGNKPLDQAINSLLAERRSDPLEQTWLAVMGRSIENQRILSSALTSTTLRTAFPNSGIGRQLRMIARLIEARGKLSLARQCFFCSIGGFDTHGEDQLQRQGQLLGEVSAAVTAFHAATIELGVAREVTLFTASDFGRNLPSNGQGSDHGWGSHHFVIGGSVQGGKMVGRFPTLAVGGPDDAGQGVWIPTTSIDQLGGELARWYGASPAQVDEIFPRLGNFDRSIGLMV
jgi:uncharacterized protein (DUF1501 family)